MPDRLAAAVAVEVARMLDERGISARRLAEMTGLQQVTISRKLRGVSALDLDDLEAICRALDVPVRDLIEWADQD